MSQPFAPPAISEISGITSPTVSTTRIDLLPVFLTLAWLCGAVVIAVRWYVRWRQICLLAQEARPLREGREVSTLRRLERVEGIRKPIEMVVSPTSIEPGIFGIVRPILVWPEGFSECLDNAQLEAVLAHEVGHVRSRDNLAAALHMLVEAIFWFHPFVWWLGARLLEERERACDEEVLALGSKRRVYAESILKTCEFCVQSPLTCMSGVTGADLKKRILGIMTPGVLRRLDFRRKLLLGSAGLATVLVPLVSGLPPAAQIPSESQTESASVPGRVYDLASIKPNKSGNNTVRMMLTPDGLSATGGNLMMLIMSGYGVNPHQISGAPSWMTSERYDIEAKMDSATADELRKLDPGQGKTVRRRMLQALLAERFKLVAHRETKELPVYALVVAKNGPKLQEAKPGDTYADAIKAPDGRPGAGMIFANRGQVSGQGLPIANLVRQLSLELGRTVVDKTGLTGKYDFTLKWTADESPGEMFKRAERGQQRTDPAPSSESSGPSIFTAIQEQLGLKLQSQKGPVEILVIDHVDRPTAN